MLSKNKLTIYIVPKAKRYIYFFVTILIELNRKYLYLITLHTKLHFIIIVITIYFD